MDRAPETMGGIHQQPLDLLLLPAPSSLRDTFSDSSFLLLSWWPRAVKFILLKPDTPQAANMMCAERK